MRPTECFDDIEDVLETLCRGCSRERGWIDVEHRWGRMCKTMEKLMADKDVVAMADGKPVCSTRHESESKRTAKERALYERRMRGDWA